MIKVDQLRAEQYSFLKIENNFYLILLANQVNAAEKRNVKVFIHSFGRTNLWSRQLVLCSVSLKMRKMHTFNLIVDLALYKKLRSKRKEFKLFYDNNIWNGKQQRSAKLAPF